MKRVYCLYRVSTKGQVDKDDIPMQRIACEKFVKAQGWTIVKEFLEKGVSGFKVSSEDRDAIQDIKKAALKSEFDILLVFMFDRLGRREDETPFVVEWFTKQGIAVWSAQEGEQRFDNHVDKLMNYIRFWQASGESIKTSMRIKTRMEQLTKEGCYTGGTIPFGYKLVKIGRVNKKGIELYDVQIDEHEAEIVRDIFSKVSREGYGTCRLATYLTEQGIRTHGGNKFSRMTLLRMICNRLYCGYYVAKDVSSPKQEHLIIIDENLFDRANEIVEQRSSVNINKRNVALNTRGQTLLSGNIYCAHCGGRLIVTQYKDSRIRADGSVYKIEQLKYTCCNKARKRAPCDGQTSYVSDEIDTVVTEILNDVFNRIKETPKEKALEKRYKSQISAFNVENKNLVAVLETHKSELEDLKKEIAKALTGKSSFSAEILSEVINTTKEKIIDTEARLTLVKGEQANSETSMSKIDYHYNQFLSWADEFWKATKEEKKMIIGQLINRIEIGKGYDVNIELNLNYDQFCNGLT